MAQGLKSFSREACREQLLRAHGWPWTPWRRPPSCPQHPWPRWPLPSDLATPGGRDTGAATQGPRVLGARWAPGRGRGPPPLGPGLFSSGGGAGVGEMTKRAIWLPSSGD